MNYEILCTSAPSSLKPGTSEFCTVKCSRGIPAPMLDLLQSLSGYRPVFTPGSAEAANNPVNWGHYILPANGRMEHILSRVSDYEPDVAGRPNKLAHHMVVGDSPLPPAGPAWLLSQRGWMTEEWDCKVEPISKSRAVPVEPRLPGRCVAWEQAAGDAGWAGVLAESFLANPERKVFVIYKPVTNILPLFEEALSLLPEHRRWDVTFATYGAALPGTVDCLWSGVVTGSPEIQESRRFADALRINLALPIPPAIGGELTELARTGKMPKRASPAPVAPPPHPLPRNDESAFRAGIAPPRSATVSPTAVTVEEKLPRSSPEGEERCEGSRARWPLVALSGAILIVALCVATVIVLQARPVAERNEKLARLETATPSGGPTDSVTVPADDAAVLAPASSIDTSMTGETANSPAGIPRIASVTPNSTSRTPDPSPPSSTPPDSTSPPPGAPPLRLGASNPSVSNSPAPGPPAAPAAAAGQPASGSPATVQTKEQSPSERGRKPADDDGKPRPTEVASAGSAMPDTAAAVAAVPKIVATIQPGLKPDGKAVTVVLPEGSRIPFSSATSTILMLPRDLADSGSSYYDIIGQNIGLTGTQIVSSRGSATVQLECQWTQKGSEPLSISLIPKANLPERRRDCYEHGVVQLRNDFTGETVFIHLVPVVSTGGERPRISSEGFLELTVPDQFRSFFRVIRPEDIRLSGLTVSMNQRPVKLQANDGGWIANILGSSEGCIQSVEIRKRGQVIDDKLRLECVFSPPVDSVKASLAKNVENLASALKDINKDGIGLDPRNPLDPRLKIPLDRAKLDEAAARLKQSNQRYFEKQARMENRPVVDPQAVMTSNDAVDEYVKALVRQRTHQRIIDDLDQSLAIESADVGYQVFSVRNPRASRGSQNEFPPGYQETVVDAWSCRPDR